MIQNIAIEKLFPHPDNPRQDLGDLEELAESIKAKGILQNLTVVPWNFVEEDKSKWDDDYDRFVVVIGHRRLAAAKQAGLTELPCAVSEMERKEQVSTMLLENMQRADLTLYEQAQGFQMMLDLGDTVKDIAEQTGFSDTTVRRRVKLLELDQEKLKASTERGATIMDYIELEKIKDIGLRNKVLESIGTRNFDYELRRALDKEKDAEIIKSLKEKLDTFATEFQGEETPASREHVATYYASWGKKEIDIPEDAEEAEYFYVVFEYGITLYKKVSESEEAARRAAEQEEKDLQKAKYEALSEISERAFELRRDFIRSFSNTKAKKKMEIIVEYTYRAIEKNSFWRMEIDKIIDFLDIQIPESDDEEEFATEHLLEDLHKQPEKYLLLVTYCSLDGPSESYHNWRGGYRENRDLDLVYDFLDALGYDISDEELSMCDGTHELFEREE